MTGIAAQRRLGPRQAAVLLSVVIALVLSLVAGHVVAWFRDGYVHTRSQGWAEFADGSPMQALARDLRETPVAAWLGQRVREAGWLVLRDTGPRVRQGCPGWLFLADEWQWNPEAQAAWQARVTLARQVATAWQQRGVRVLMALVPDKIRIERAGRCDLVWPSRLSARYDRWLEAMRAHGVPVVDLRAALLATQHEWGSAYARTDTHWRWQGARASALAIAEALRRQGFTPATDWKMNYTTGPPAARWGDLVRLAGIDALPPRWRPPPDMVETLRFSVLVEAGHTQLTEELLFGDGPAVTTVGLVGTSFSRNAHFADFLAWAAQAEVANLARDGGGFAQSMEAAWQRWATVGGIPAVRWIVWEVPERTLEEPLGAAEQSLVHRLAL